MIFRYKFRHKLNGLLELLSMKLMAWSSCQTKFCNSANMSQEAWSASLLVLKEIGGDENWLIKRV